MKSDLATVIQAMVTDENEKAFFVQKNGQTYQLPKAENTSELTIGSVVKGFVYENSSKRKMMTLDIPQVNQDHYGWVRVTEVRKDLGVFVDIGLPDKDIVVSLDELPTITSLWPKKGNQLYTTLIMDKKDRMWATLAEDSRIKALSHRATEYELNKDKKATVFRLKLAGTQLITEDGFICFLHPSERFYEPTLGEQLSVRVIGVKPDGTLNVSARPRAHEAISDDAQMILMMLKNSPTHIMPYGDKSSPEAIKEAFGISKGQFKRALGSLLKARQIEQIDGCISMTETALAQAAEEERTAQERAQQELIDSQEVTESE
ncbi:hypothetical protein SAMN05421767_10368 [Granulicatella balaenopterae]|uniref:S1 motif domain-containing protein n=1 Tax=Granulicatella balaenopterae TaxID=137733 RepID=A0A1H9HUM0_9LACT|nr:S1-like domain-containing RNA-binding protein [Granulicatella balaenopterae]SEQ65988.1 hypothetical protein SAMN05421767_10368 [Granulicatella balaenopterae]